ncbi:hypothetical protein EJB05_25826, partial [Eragrostis curvula]
MAAVPAHALAADRRWAAVAAAPTRAPGAGALGTATKPTNLPTERSTLEWGNKPVPTASNALGSSSVLSLNNEGGSGSLANINVRPASGGSSGSSTSGSDFLDSPLAWDEKPHPVSASDVLTLQNPSTARSRPRWTDSRSGSLQFSRFQTSFSEALKGPIRSIAKQGPASRGKGFTLSADDFPVLASKNSESKSQLGHNSQGQPTFGSGSVATQGEQRKNLVAGGDPVPDAKLPMEEQKAQPHGTQAPHRTVPPPWPDRWSHPPDHPPDRNMMWHRESASYGAFKPANTPGTGSLPVESLTHSGQGLLNQEGEARHGPVHGGNQPENRDSCYAHVPTDVCATSKPHLISGKVKDNHSDTPEKQPFIKKDLVLLEKIRCLNIKARNLRARYGSEISSCRESKAECTKNIDAKTNQVSKYIPSSAITNGVAAACDLANSVSQCGNLVLTGPSNESADSVIVGLPGGHVTESDEPRKSGKSADYHVYGGGNSSRSPFNIASDVFGNGWEEHSTVDSLSVVKNTRQSRFPGNSPLQAHMRTADDVLNSPDREIQHSKRRELSAQHTKQLPEEARNKIQQKAESVAKQEKGGGSAFLQSQKSNDALIEADKTLHKQKAGGIGTTKHHISTSDTCFIDGAKNRNVSLTENGVKDTTVSFRSTPASDTAGVDSDPLIHNVMPSAKKSNINMMEHIAQKSATQSCDTIVPKLLLTENRQRQGHSRDRILRERSNITDNTEYITKVAGMGTQSSVKDLASKICGHGWEEHSSVDSLPVVMSNQDRSFPENSSLQVHVRTSDGMLNFPDCEIQHSKSREVSAQLQEERGKIEQKVKSIAKLQEVNSRSFVQSRKSNDSPIEADKSLSKQKTSGSGTTEHDTSTDTCRIDYAENRNVPLTEHGVKNTTVSISYTPAASGVTKGPVIHNGMASAKKTGLNMMQHIAQKSAADSNDTIVPKLLPMENRPRRVHSQERILRERSNIAENTKYTTNHAGTLMDTRSSEDKRHVGLSTENENRRPVPPHAFCTENTEALGVQKSHTTGVVISSSIIPAQVATVRGFTVGSILLGDASLASVNHEKTVAKEVHDTVNGSASPQQKMQSEKDQHGVQHAKLHHRNDSVMRTPVEEPSKQKQSEVGGLNCTAIHAPTKRSEMEKLACEEQLQNLGPIPVAENHTTPYNETSTSRLETDSCDKEALGTSTATKAEAQTEAGIRNDRLPEKKNRKNKKASRHGGRSSTPGYQVSSNGSASFVPKLRAEAANSLLLNVMQELSVKAQQAESKTHVGTEYFAQPTRTVLLPDDTWKMHLEGQGNPQNNYASYIGTRPPVPTAPLLPQPIFRPQVNALVNGVPGWTWDLDEGILMSDMENLSGVGIATVNRSSGKLNQNVFSSGAVDLHGREMAGDMTYQAAIPAIQYNTALEHQQLSPAWNLIAQQNGMHHGGSGTGVYWPMMERDAGMQTHVTNYTAGPVASSDVAYVWSQGHPGSNLMVPH